jgi:hypothetical protein
MRRSVLLVLSVAFAVLVFAPLAAAQTNYKGMGRNQAGHMRVDHRGMDNNMMASPTSSASASASAMSSPSASASAMSTSASASASPTSSAGATTSAGPTATASATALPDTGGTPLIPLLSAAVLVLLVSSGIAAIALIRRSS